VRKADSTIKKGGGKGILRQLVKPNTRGDSRFCQKRGEVSLKLNKNIRKRLLRNNSTGKVLKSMYFKGGRHDINQRGGFNILCGELLNPCIKNENYKEEHMGRQTWKNHTGNVFNA